MKIVSSVAQDESKEEHIISVYEREGLTSDVIAIFQQLILGYFCTHGRKFPWRDTDDPYYILVSEIMLQQTQTSRVLTKYEEFIKTFPNVNALAGAPLVDVLKIWQGMGYNRRAISLHKMARIIMHEYNGEIPSSSGVLQQLPGVGSYTAAAIAAIAFNQPEVCIETNIRTVFTYFFFHNRDKVSDQEILPLVDATMDRKDARQWYYALFDYGAMLKVRVKINSKSAYHRKQGAFHGSNREMRGQILRLLLSYESLSKYELVAEVKRDYTNVLDNVHQLQKEGFLTIDGDNISIA